MKEIILACAVLAAVDGDTVKCDGVNMRIMGDGAPYESGIDTPELRGKCQQEVELARAAKGRLEELLETSGAQVIDSGERDRWKRPLVWVRMPDGRTAGAILLEEGHARIWTPGYQADWCN